MHMFNVKVVGVPSGLSSERLTVLRTKLRSATQLVESEVTDIFISLDGYDPRPLKVDMTITFEAGEEANPQPGQRRESLVDTL
jgi:hypothetical protein